MPRVTDEQVDFILNDIKARGVVLEDLQDNLLDHMCCIVENEMPENADFYKFYDEKLPLFFQHELKELQVEVDILLTFKNYYAMKKMVIYSGIISSTLILIGAILKTMHWPGAATSLVSGGLVFGFFFLPLMIIIKLKDEQHQMDKWVQTFGFLLALGVFFGIMFKVMHWPGASIFKACLTLFIFAYVPLYFFTRIRRPDLRFNTIVNTSLMMATGGMLYAMVNLGYATQMHEKTNISPKESAPTSEPAMESTNIRFLYNFTTKV